MTFKKQVSRQRHETWWVCFIALGIYCGKAYSIHDSLKTMAGGMLCKLFCRLQMVLSVNLYGEQEAADPSRGAWPLPAYDH